MKVNALAIIIQWISEYIEYIHKCSSYCFAHQVTAIYVTNLAKNNEIVSHSCYKVTNPNTN